MDDSVLSEIKQLKDQGYGAKRIAKALNLNRGTVAYHLSDTIKAGCQRQGRIRNDSVLYRKYKNFMARKSALAIKKCDFARRTSSRKAKYDFTFEELVEHIGSEPKCYLTGEPIDITNASEYSLDHIIPSARGGTNTLDNLGVTTKHANLAKSDLVLDELLLLCKKILTHNGYSVEKVEEGERLELSRGY